MSITLKLVVPALLAALTLAAAPVSARIVYLAVTGKITAGTDGGNDILDTQYVGGVLTNTYTPGTVFGTSGSLIGKTIVFRMAYDTTTAPIGAGGVFDDLGNGQWTYDAKPKVSIGGVWVDMIVPMPGMTGLGIGSKLTVSNGTPDGLLGEIFAFTSAGNVVTDYRSKSLDFAAVLPAGYFDTDAVLPGDGSLLDLGLGGSSATGTGHFFFSSQTCVIDCSYKEASGAFTLSSLAFVPEAPVWVAMIGGFGLVGGVARRRRAMLACAA